MTDERSLTLFHCPQTRSSTTRIILDELGAPYKLHVMNLKAGEHREPGYLKINPLGKVPAIKHGETIITEQIAIAIYLGDLFPQAGLAPAISDTDRGRYLRWMLFYAACFEPALVDKAQSRDPGPETMSVYGTYDQMLDVVEMALSHGPYLLGDRFSIADIQWASAFHWTMMFGLLPERPAFVSYRDRIIARPSFQHAFTEDQSLAEAHQAALNAKE
ncbi:glutathione S-transferase family protein [Cohaesibacter sp. CAU 1516]|uniref:glutathione S-transferase family protein n=1 Tax=Cohaesibacter sp. CAU 1516 TaxID=2576038 RepID=UPI0010FE5A7C|nr:glutathione S-transferase family protein [Cohaesibacter sp. CAU 1516]TLP43848.1 glutathione S-transferase family protein [Cohaesibacter sp. CAU 1516]